MKRVGPLHSARARIKDLQGLETLVDCVYILHILLCFRLEESINKKPSKTGINPENVCSQDGKEKPRRQEDKQIHRIFWIVDVEDPILKSCFKNYLKIWKDIQ